jgi:hypothetical protein
MTDKFGLLYQPIGKFCKSRYSLHDGDDVVEDYLAPYEYKLTQDLNDNMKAWRLFGYKRRKNFRRASRSIEEAMDNAMEKFSQSFGKIHG